MPLKLGVALGLLWFRQGVRGFRSTVRFSIRYRCSAPCRHRHPLALLRRWAAEPIVVPRYLALLGHTSRLCAPTLVPRIWQSGSPMIIFSLARQIPILRGGRIDGGAGAAVPRITLPPCTVIFNLVPRRSRGSRRSPGFHRSADRRAGRSNLSIRSSLHRGVQFSYAMRRLAPSSSSGSSPRLPPERAPWYLRGRGR